MVKGIIKGIRHANSVPLLPKELDLLDKSIFIWIFKVVGSYSYILVLMKVGNHTDLHIGWTIIAFIYMIYMFHILIYNVVYIIENRDKFEVIDSSQGKKANRVGILFVLMKSGLIGLFTYFGLGLCIDEMLKQTGRDPVFVKAAGLMIRKI